jgi:DNA polymerase III subunit delta'
MTSVFDGIVGQDHAITQLRNIATQPVHAFLFVGPEGCGKEEIARAFASLLLSGSEDSTDRVNDLVVRGAHIDVHDIRRVGASISAEQADDVIRLAATTPVEASRKVIIIHEVHLMRAEAVVRLLKTIEEPPEGVFFILLADDMPSLLVTIASRCLVTHFVSLDNDLIAHTLINEGIAADTASFAAQSAHGSLARARLLATDTQLVTRMRVFTDIPARIDGTGSTVVAITDQILGLIDDAAEPLMRQHESEIAVMEETLATMGVKRGGKKALEDKHKRELRRHRTDELRAGLTAIASRYRDELTQNTDIHRPDAYVEAIERIHSAMNRLSLNVNETILLRDLLWQLPPLHTDAIHPSR